MNQQKLRVDLYARIMNRLSHECKLNNIDKKIIILLFNHVNESRYMKIKRQNALTLILKFEKSNFFIIFTCNFNHLSSLEICSLKSLLRIDQIYVIKCFNRNSKN